MDTSTQPLTRFSAGSLRELLAIAWPMILSSAAGCLMIVEDRLILSRYSPEAFSVNIGSMPWYWAAMDIALSIVSISGVLVGRYNGARRFSHIGPVVWQMLWFSVFLWIPIMLWLVPFIPRFLAENIRELGATYLRIMFYFLPVQCAAFGALASFFTGRGKTKIVLGVVLVANVANLLFDWTLIFGAGPIPPMGIAGAALGSGIAQTMSFGILFFLFLRRRYRHLYRTWDCSFRWDLWRQCLRIGTPSALTRLINSFLWAWIIQVCAQKTSHEEFLIYGMSMTIYAAFFFLIEGTGYGVTIVDSNAIGSQQMSTIVRNTRSWVFLSFAFCGALSPFMIFYPEPFFRLFSIDFQSESTALMAREFLIWSWLLFTTEFFHFNYFAIITAFGDTIFRMLSAPICYVLLVIIPTYHSLYYGSHRALVFIQCSLLNEVVMTVLFFVRYQWLLKRQSARSVLAVA
jgi:MATE family multidrug resistance protein